MLSILRGDSSMSIVGTMDQDLSKVSNFRGGIYFNGLTPRFGLFHKFSETCAGIALIRGPNFSLVRCYAGQEMYGLRYFESKIQRSTDFSFFAINDKQTGL